jgi:hypothetical protein
MVGKILTAAEANKLESLRSGGGPITPEVEAVREMPIGAVLHLADVSWEMDPKTGKPTKGKGIKHDADTVANRISTDANKRGYKVRTSKVKLNGKAAGIRVVKSDPDAGHLVISDDEDDE